MFFPRPTSTRLRGGIRPDLAARGWRTLWNWDGDVWSDTSLGDLVEAAEHVRHEARSEHPNVITFRDRFYQGDGITREAYRQAWGEAKKEQRQTIREHLLEQRVLSAIGFYNEDADNARFFPSYRATSLEEMAEAHGARGERQDEFLRWVRKLNGSELEEALEHGRQSLIERAQKGWEIEGVEPRGEAEPESDYLARLGDWMEANEESIPLDHQGFLLFVPHRYFLETPSGDTQGHQKSQTHNRQEDGISEHRD